ncbi:YchJ family protein [Leeia oryzae]|uniref:YchJ family protein n=1 Tax=Leeia oryzae TaxID=356662 RepID=UPI00037027BD|nr:YchJ family metal-binding protein [Leeia oryzae]
MKAKPVDLCPCGSQRPASACCLPLLDGLRPAATPEALMRSRYVAYVLGNEPYLLRTWAAENRPDSLGLADDTATKWLGLTVHHARQANDREGEVRFTARYKVQGKAHRLTETSRFRLEGEQWVYVDGVIEEA